MVSDWLLLISCCLLLVSPLVGCWMVVGGRWLIGWCWSMADGCSTSFVGRSGVRH